MSEQQKQVLLAREAIKQLIAQKKKLAVKK